MRGFVHFLRTQGIAGLAIGFIMGTAAQQFVQAFSRDIVSPVVGKGLGAFGDLKNASSTVAGMSFGWGDFVSELVNLVVIAFVVYIFFRMLRLDRLDEKKEG